MISGVDKSSRTGCISCVGLFLAPIGWQNETLAYDGFQGDVAWLRT